MKISINKRKLLSILIQFVIYLFFLFSFGIKWCMTYFGNISLNEIVFTLNMPLKGASNEYYYTFFKEAFLPSVITYLIFRVICIVINNISHKIIKYEYFCKYKLFKIAGKFSINKLLFHQLPKFLFCAAWIFLIYETDKNYKIFEYVKNNIEASNFIENEYVNAKEINIRFPENKKNLICIFIESAETTFQDIESGGVFDDNIITEMTNIAESNISFSQSELLQGAAVAPGTGWTIAALVAQTSGMPLKMYGYGAGNKMGNYEFFLPGVISIGELLEQQGYHNFFMAGSDFSYGGREDYFTQHGNYEIWDYYSAVEEKKIAEDYKVNWGFEDQRLYEYAKEKLLKLASMGEPFNFSMLTVDTHTGGGYVCDLCPDTFESQYANVWACASSQIADFLDWIEEQEFYDDTVIYIAGDHSSMQGDFVTKSDYDKYNGDTDRNVYNVFINSCVEPIKEKNRKFTTLDFCPSILAALGADIEGNRIGLGTNLFSGEQTLSEKYGYEELFNELGKKSVFYNKEIMYP